MGSAHRAIATTPFMGHGAKRPTKEAESPAVILGARDGGRW